MSVFTPTLSREELSSGPGATEFRIEDPAHVGEVPPVLIRNSAVPVYMQGEVLDLSDLNIQFFKDGIIAISPFSLTFSIGYLQQGVFKPVGPLVRQPLMLRVGRFCPNFKVGTFWKVGDYLIRWVYQMSDGSTPVTIDTPFRVNTLGVVSDRTTLTGVLELSATVVILEGYLDRE